MPIRSFSTRGQRHVDTGADAYWAVTQARETLPGNDKCYSWRSVWNIRRKRKQIIQDKWIKFQDVRNPAISPQHKCVCFHEVVMKLPMGLMGQSRHSSFNAVSCSTLLLVVVLRWLLHENRLDTGVGEQGVKRLSTRKHNHATWPGLVYKSAFRVFSPKACFQIGL